MGTQGERLSYGIQIAQSSGFCANFTVIVLREASCTIRMGKIQQLGISLGMNRPASAWQAAVVLPGALLRGASLCVSVAGS